MGAINGFRLDSNGDGRISQQEFQKAKKLGLDVTYLDKDNDGKVDKGVTARANSILVGNEERIYEGSNLGNNQYGIMSTSIFTNSDGTKSVQGQDDIIVSKDSLNQFLQKDE